MPLPEEQVPQLVPLAVIDAAQIVTLLDAAFGADRHQRTAYKVRVGTEWLPEYSVAVTDGSHLLGTAQGWPVAVIDEAGERSPLIMVGPVAVIPEMQGTGIGKQMTHAICDALDLHGESGVMIGDPEYYERFFGFRSGPASGWSLPGPVEARRVLLRPAPGTRWPARGQLGPDPLHNKGGLPN
ncbi:GNAT family N-acetyltransferase [Parasphingopyxis sp.]|uniref:GNAT family N-acetyltransferase n=1 Tax=Parasphingopyxis sp. TaxID=1920299 RepID=UPI0032F07114